MGLDLIIGQEYETSEGTLTYRGVYIQSPASGLTVHKFDRKVGPPYIMSIRKLKTILI